MSTEHVQGVLLIVFIVEACAVVVSGFYIFYVYRQRSAPSSFLDLLVRNAQRSAIGVGVILGLTILSRLGHTLPPPWGSLVVTAALGIILWSPIATALAFRRERRNGS